MAATEHRRRRTKQARRVLYALIEFWQEILAVVFLAVGILVLVDGEKTNEEPDPYRPLLDRADAFAGNGDKKRAFFSYGVATTFAACPDQAWEAMIDLRDQLNLTQNGWGRISEVPYRSECCPFHVGPLPDEQPNVEARILADPRLVGDGEFQGLDPSHGAIRLTGPPYTAPGRGSDPYMAAFRARLLRFVAPPKMTLEELEAAYGPPIPIQEDSESFGIVRYGRTVIVLDDQDAVVEVLRWLKPVRTRAQKRQPSTGSQNIPSK